jgi:hypothetical protein
MNLGIGERAIYRSLHWQVAGNSTKSYVELFGRSRENQGCTVRVVPAFEPVERAHAPTQGWKALHNAYRLTLSHGRRHLASVGRGRLISEPYQLVPMQLIENLLFPTLILANNAGLGKTAEAGAILFHQLQRGGAASDLLKPVSPMRYRTLGQLMAPIGAGIG